MASCRILLRQRQRSTSSQGRKPFPNSDIAGKFSIALTKKVQYFDVAPEQPEDSMRNLGMPEWMIRIYPELFAICKAGQASAVSSDVAQVLKRKATGFDEFLRDHPPLLLSFHWRCGQVIASFFIILSRKQSQALSKAQGGAAISD